MYRLKVLNFMKSLCYMVLNLFLDGCIRIVDNVVGFWRGEFLFFVLSELMFICKL